MLLGVVRRVAGVEAQGPDRTLVRRIHDEPGPRGSGNGSAPAQRAQETGARPAPGVGDQQHAEALREADRLADRRQGARVEQTQHGSHLGVGQHHRGQRLRWLPVGPLGGGDQDVGRVAAEQPEREPVEVALPHAARRLQLVGVARDRGRGELVDVGEDQLGERGQHVGRHSRLDRGLGELTPRDTCAHAVRREQGVGAPSAARLAATQRVRALERGGQRRTGIGRAAPGRQPEESRERHLHGVLDVVTHRPAERAGVGRHLLGHRVDGVRGDLGETSAQKVEQTGIQREATNTNADLGIGHAKDCSIRTKNERSIHARWSGIVRPGRTHWRT